MLNPEELQRVYQRAYVPEHLPNYVAAIAGAEAHLLENRLCYTRQSHLIFIGYPLKGDPQDNPYAYEAACKQFQPSTVAIIAPEIWALKETAEAQPADVYYRLKLPAGSLAPGVAYMLRRAERELSVHTGRFGKEHRKLIKAFIDGHDLSEQQKNIFKNIKRYQKNSSTSRLLEARKRGRLAAFTIVDLGSADSAYYMFNFRSPEVPIPGASDLLLREMIRLARAEGKKALNLGLGINTGIRRFKEKWGGAPFLPYAAAMVHRGTADFDQLAKKL